MKDSAEQSPAAAAGRIPDASDPTGATLADPELSRLGPRASWRGRYVILRTHAEGGLGVISLALDETLGRKVALKQMRPELADDANLRARFIREAEITGQLEHPGIIPLYSLGQDEQGRPYYAMKFVEGMTFADAIAEYHATESSRTPLALRDLLRRFVEICEAVAYAHSQGIIRRDLKPTNIMVGKFGQTLILDWGLARRAGEGSAAAVPAQSGKPVGTPSYMPPEQASGQGQSIGPAADVYGLGAVLYQLLTGAAPYSGDSSKAVVERVLAGPPPAPSTLTAVPRALEVLCLKAMEREPMRRPGAAELAREVERWLSDEPLRSYRGSPVDAALRWMRHHRTATGSVLSVLAAGLIALTVGTALVSREKSARLIALEQRATALAGEAQQRQLAEQREALLRRHVYAADMRDAIAAWDDGYGHRAMDLLDAQRPGPGQQDLRGFEWRLLSMQMFGARSSALKVPGGAAAVLVFSPDGAVLAAAAADRSIVLYDVARRAPRDTLRGHTATILAMRFSPDGQTLASADAGGQVRLWGLHSDARRLVVSAHERAANAVSFSPDGRTLASAGADGALKFWNIADGSAAAAPIMNAGAELRCCAYSPDGSFLAGGDADGKLRIWDLVHRSVEPLTLISQRHPVEAVEYSPDGTQLSTCISWNAAVWDLKTGDKLCEFNHSGSVQGAVFSGDGRSLATLSGGGQANVWDLAGGTATPQRKRSFAVPMSPSGMAYSADGRTLATFGDSSTLWLWDVSATEDPHEIGEAEHPVNAVCLGADGSIAVAGTGSGMIELWDVASARRITQEPAGAAVTVLGITRDGSTLGVGDADGGLSIWSLSPLRRRAAWRAHSQPIKSVLFCGSEANLTVVTSAADAVIKVWDVASGLERALRADVGPVAALSSDGAWIAAGGGATGRPTRILKMPELADAPRPIPVAGSPSCLAFSPSAATLALGFIGGNALLYDLNGDPSSELLRLQTTLFSVTAVTFLDDGRRLVTANPYRSIQFWDPVTGDECGTFDANVAMDSPVAVSADGSTIAVVTRDHRMRVWQSK